MYLFLQYILELNEDYLELKHCKKYLVRNVKFLYKAEFQEHTNSDFVRVHIWENHVVESITVKKQKM